MTSRLVVVLAWVTIALSGCVPASPDVDTFDDKMMRTAGTAVAEVRTVERLVRLLDTDRMLRPSAIAQLRYSEEGLGTAATSFTELNPPPARDRLADRLGALLDEAETLVADTRVVIERKEVGDYDARARDLEAVATELEALEASLR